MELGACHEHIVILVKCGEKTHNVVLEDPAFDTEGVRKSILSIVEMQLGIDPLKELLADLEPPKA